MQEPRHVELEFPTWAAPLAPIIAAFLERGGRFTVHCAPGDGAKRVEVSFTLQQADIEPMVRRLGLPRICNGAMRAINSA